MAAETRRSFKDKARDRLGLAFRGKAYSTDQSSQEKENAGAGQRARPAEVNLHGHLNPLAWENLPQMVRESLQPATSAPAPEVDQKNANTAAMKPLEPTKTETKRRSRHLSQPEGTLEYQVSGTDTLNSIAAQFDTTPSVLKRVNKLFSNNVFPGQALYIPDKDYLPPKKPVSARLSDGPLREEEKAGESGRSSLPSSQPSSKPSSLASTPASIRKFFSTKKDKPVVRQADRPRVPGHAERIPSDSSDSKPKALSEVEARKLDEECYERFIKVNVKHITDGKGVVSGVLLVTPNAIMFDPNVSDPLVLEHGADTYGMIAPMETIISAAMYHDIAAMKIKGMPRDGKEDSPKPEVYHSQDCPMYGQQGAPSRQGSDASAGGEEDEQVAEADVAGQSSLVRKLSKRHRQDSTCSCGALDAVSPSDPRPADTDITLMNQKLPEERELEADKEAASVSFLVGDDDTQENTAAESVTVMQQALLELDVATTRGHHEDTCSTDEAPGGDETSAVPMGGTAELPMSTSPASSVPDNQDDCTADTECTGQAAEASKHSLNSEDKSADANQENRLDAAPKCPQLSPSSQIGNIQYFDYNSVAGSGSVAGAGAGAGAGLPTLPSELPDVVPLSDTANADKSVSPQGDVTAPGSQPSILSRTLGSISSFGSFSTSPNFSQLVDFSSGLFSRSQDERGRVQDITDVSTNSPPATPKKVWDVDMEEVQAELKGATDGTCASVEQRPVNGETVVHQDIAVESVVKLDDKPELFQSLDELIPRPARQYDDPPLYLCLKVGQPINKTVSKTCPVESYMKKKPKPEYWFSIPRDRVDHLYAFFIQWSPNIYGGEDEIDPKERGFVVIEDEEEEEENINVVEDHFKSEKQRLIRQISMSKDWELVNVEEARRRLSLLEDEALPLPELSTPSTILHEEETRKLIKNLPARCEGYPWTLVYSSDKNGFSLKTMYRSMARMDSPILLLIKDTRDQVFGALLSCALTVSDHFYGTGESFLFTFHKEFKKFAWTGSNNFFIKGNAESLAIGAGEGSFGLWLDGDIYHGRTQHCQTFDNELLTETEDFMVKGLEAWAFL